MSSDYLEMRTEQNLRYGHFLYSNVVTGNAIFGSTLHFTHCSSKENTLKLIFYLPLDFFLKVKTYPKDLALLLQKLALVGPLKPSFVLHGK